jgi:predicted XRE-type DNA-binding protein
MSKSISILNQLKAESLLGESDILKQIEELRDSMRYASTGDEVSFDDYFLFLQGDVDKISSIKLLDRIPSETESEYTNQLISLLESIQDDCERVEVRLIGFQGKVISAQSQVDELAVAFEAWFSLAATEVLQDAELKLAATQIRSIAKSEFNRLMDRSNLALATIIEALKVERSRVQNKKKMAQKKFELGKEQVNAAWTNKLPALLGINPNPPDLGLRSRPDFEPEEPEDSVPAFISKKSMMGPMTNVPCLTACEPVITNGKIADIFIAKESTDEYVIETLKSKKGVFEKILGQSHTAGLLDDSEIVDTDTGAEETPTEDEAGHDVDADGSVIDSCVHGIELELDCLKCPSDRIPTAEELLSETAVTGGIYKTGDPAPAFVIEDAVIEEPVPEVVQVIEEPVPTSVIETPPQTQPVPERSKRKPLIFDYDDELV